MMLQQTTVATVLPRYESFLERFPAVEALAEAKVEDVLAAWSGLGYYTRARNLHAAAIRVVREHQGVFPKDPVVVRDLPGFGDYSTAAILSIVHGLRMAVVDGNVIRVVSRLATLPGHAKSPALRKAVQVEADRLIDPGEPGDFNQAMMELGATICSPASPACGGCPVEQFCAARRLGRVGEFPARPPVRAVTSEEWQVAIVESAGRLLMRRRPETESLMPGMWELPAWLTPDSASIRAHLERDLGEGAMAIVPAGDARHAIMNRRLRLNVHHVALPRRAAPTGWHWIEPARFGELPVSSMVSKAIEAARGQLKLAFALVLVAIQATTTAVPTRAADPADSASVGETAGIDTLTIPPPIVPELLVRDIAGKEVSLHALLAKGPVLLNFWALWCKPCLKEIPELVKLQETYAARGFSLVLVNGDSPSDVARVAPFARARKMPGPVVTDVDGALRRRFQANAFPTSILLDRSGRTAWSAQGYRPGDEVKLAGEIEALLNE